MDRQVSVHKPVSDNDIRDLSRILENNSLDDLPPISSRTVRVFLSSTFSDMIQERNALMEKVYPKLKTHCRERHGLEFQMMDLRWGIRDESQNDHTTIDFCLKAIENCKAHSVGPSFVAFLGQKYGYRPFPPNIKAGEFHNIYQALRDAGKDVSDLDLWYKKDTNITPPVYNLQPITSVLKDFTSKDPKRQELARTKWEETFMKLRTLLRDGAELCLQGNTVDQRVRDKYFVSVTEYEIYHGLFSSPNPETFALAFYREITNLDEHLETRRGRKFVDIDPRTGDVDLEARHLMLKLKNSKLPKALEKRPSSMCQLEVHWQNPAKQDPTEDPDYLEKFCNRFLTMMVRLIDKAATRANRMNQDPYVVEVIEHLKMCRLRVDVFRGREEIIQSIKDYILSECRAPMVLHGVSGSGKTSIIAKAASLVHQWLPGSKPVRVLRFLGTTARSTSVRLVLGCMCWQIDAGYGRRQSEIPVDYPGLVNYFCDILKLATADKPLVILLDSLDQMSAMESSHQNNGDSVESQTRRGSADKLASPEKPLVILLDSLDQLSRTHNAHDLNWLPKQLPPHCYVVVSMLTYEYDILETLKADIRCHDYFHEVAPLGSQAGEVIIQDWLKCSGRSLTTAQYTVVHEALLKCSLPLYARLVFDKVCTWKSYAPADTTRLEYTVKGVISKLFDRIEKYHGVTFVKHILSYLTASKNGLSDTEIEDVLSLDDEVLNDVFTYWLPPVRRIPPLLWPRLQNELGSYIMQRESNGVIVYFWYHRQFCKVVEERYLTSPDHVIYTHTVLAHYYMGTWGGGKKKAFKYTAGQAKELGLSKTESEADRMVPLQPLQFSTNPAQPKRLRYNIRKLSELPFHLVKCRQSNTLKQEVLFNYTWLITKLRAMSLHDVLGDFRFAIDSGGFKDVIDIQLLSNCLRISGGNIRGRPEVLGFELAGRLLPYFSQYPYIKSFIHQCDTLALNDSAFLPLYQCFEAPRGMLNYILEDHTQNVLDLLFSHSTKQLVSLSKDATIAFWDLRTGERTCVIDLSPDAQPESSAKLFQSRDGRYLTYDSFAINSPVHIYEMRSGKLLYRVGRRTNTQRRCWSEGNLLVRQKNIIDVTRGQVIKTLDDFIETKKYLTCGIAPNEEFILLGEEDKISMFDLQSSHLLTEFPGNQLPSMFNLTPDSRRCYVGYSVDCMFKVLDVDRKSKSFSQVLLEYNYLKAYPDLKFVEPSMYSNELSSIAFSPADDSKVVINIKRAQLILLDVKKCQSKLLDRSKVVAANQTFVSHARFSCDGKFLISAEGHMMNIWEANMDSPKLIASVAIHSIDRFPISINNDRNLIATGSTLHTAVKVWDLDKIYTCPGAQIKVYENPLEMITCSSNHRLLFVKIYHGLAAKVGYKFIDYFGVDVWNMSTGRSASCLPMGRYGQLLDMEASPDGSQMALLINNRDQAYAVVVSFKLGRVLATFVHSGAVAMAISPHWDFVATEAWVEGTHCIKLWSVKAGGSGGEIDTFMWAQQPVFTLDGEHLLYSLNHNCVEVFSLRRMSGANSIVCDADRLDIIPTTPQMVMVTTLARGEDEEGDGFRRGKRTQPSVSIWDITAGLMISQFSHAAPGGMKDISKDGRICIDGYLQVFEIKSGRLLVDLGNADNKQPAAASDSPSPPREELQQVCLTYDGQYALWVDGLTLRAGRVNDGRLIGCLCTHEVVVSLRLLDFGYIVVIGLVDGHMIATKLVDGTNKIGNGFEPLDLKERTDWLMKKLIYPDGIVATFDPHYQCRPLRLLPDSHLPHFTKEMQGTLEEKARVPHAVIKTSSFDNLKELEKKEKKRRGSSPITQRLFEGAAGGRRSKETSPVSSATNSPATLPRRKKYHKSQSTGEVLGHSSSHSKATGLHLGGSRDRSPSLHDLLSTQKVLQNTGSMLMALTDMTPVGKFFKRKSVESTLQQGAVNSPLLARRFDVDAASGTATLSKYQQQKDSKDGGDGSAGYSQGNSRSNSTSSGGAHGEANNNNEEDEEDEIVNLRRTVVAAQSEYRREVGRSRFYSSSDLPEVSRL